MKSHFSLFFPDNSSSEGEKKIQPPLCLDTALWAPTRPASQSVLKHLLPQCGEAGLPPSASQPNPHLAWGTGSVSGKERRNYLYCLLYESVLNLTMLGHGSKWLPCQADDKRRSRHSWQDAGRAILGWDGTADNSTGVHRQLWGALRGGRNI